MSPSKSENIQRLRGVIERITFQNPENSYTVLKLEPAGRTRNLITVLGIFPSVSVGETIEVEGKWIMHPSYGQQFQADHYNSVFPVTIDGIVKFLGSGLIKGIGPVTAKRIVDTFGSDTLDIIENHTERLTEVEGIGEKKIAIIQNGWEERKHVKDLMLFLSGYNISTTLALKIYRHYGARAISVLQQDPYQLVYDISGIGFITADKIAQELGISLESPSRIKAGLHYVLYSATDEGHVYIPKVELIHHAAEILKVSEDRVVEALEGLLAEKRVVIEAENIYPASLYYSETEIAQRLQQINNQPVAPLDMTVLENEIAKLEQKWKLTLADQQKDAIKKAFLHPILVLTGGPGTGKTTTLRSMIELFLRHHLRVGLGAPTGRAAKRLEETTGYEAKTIHRLLEFNPRTSQFTRDQQNPLPNDVIVIDEVSMMDLPLFFNLLRGISRGARVVLVGDVDQLPAVGPGNILKDIIGSGVVEVVTLNRIFRQAGTSDIITNAHCINRGDFPYLTNQKDDNFFFVKEEDPVKVAETIKNLCTFRIPQRYHFDPFMEVQVITPMYKGEAGANNLNTILQNALNPQGSELQRGGRIFRVGDKVMQIRNNYQKDIYNGDIGRISAIELETQEVMVKFEERTVIYDFSELDEIVLAYAITVHKSQGSEYKAVVMPILTQHYIMLQRNLLYTAVTRAKSLFIMVGTKKALALAIKNNKIATRYTSLAERMKKEV